jgi:hypothetical protein
VPIIQWIDVHLIQRQINLNRLNSVERYSYRKLGFECGRKPPRPVCKNTLKNCEKKHRKLKKNTLGEILHAV